MKQTLLRLIILTLFWNCSPSKDGKMDFSQLTFSMDTVLVDSKDEILFLKARLNSSDLSIDRKQIYNFNNDTHTLEIIDLDSNTFKERVKFEKEGPDGVGNYVQSVYSIDREKLLVNAFMQSGVFDLQGKKIQNINLKDLSGETMGRGEMLSHPLIHPDYHNQFLGIYNDFSFQSVHLGKINTEQNVIKKIPLENFAYLKEFFTQWIGDSGFPEGFLGPALYRTTFQDKVIISHSIANDFYIYDFEKDSIYFKTVNLNSIPERKTGKYPKEVNSKTEFFNTLKDFGSEINFQKPIWDSEKEVFYRLANINKWKEVEGEWKSEEAEVYLIIMDQEFNVLAETKVEGYSKSPTYHFTKDGKIWLFENIDDEMAFVRISF